MAEPSSPHPNQPKTFAELVAIKFTTDKTILEKLYSTKFHLPEKDFLAECLNILSGHIGTLSSCLFEFLNFEFGRTDKTILRSNTLTTKILDLFIQQRGRNFLKMVLKEPVTIILNDENIKNVEIEKNKVLQHMKEGGDTNVRVSDLNPLSKTYIKIYSQVKKNAVNLKRCIKLFADYIFNDDTKKLMPFELKVISSYIKRLSEKHSVDPLPRVGSLIILRLFGPGILFPQKTKIVNKKISTNHRRALLLIAKSIQELSNRVESKEVAMKHVRDLIEELQPKSDKFLSDICIEQKEIEEKQEILKKLLGYSLDQRIFNEVALFMYNFFLSKKMDFNLPLLKGPDGKVLEYGRIVYSAIYKTKNQKKRTKKAIKFSCINSEFKSEEKKYVDAIEKLWSELIVVIEKEPFGEKNYDINNLEICKQLGVHINVVFSEKIHALFFSISKGEFCNQLCVRFLRDCVGEFNPKFTEKNSSEVKETMEDLMAQVNNGMSFNPKDLTPFVRFYLYRKEEDEQEDDEDDDDKQKKGRRSIFSNMPSFDKVKEKYKKAKKKSVLERIFPSNDPVSILDSKSYRDEW